MFKNVSDSDRKTYKEIGGFLTPGGMDDFDFTSMNKRELVYRAKYYAAEKNFILFKSYCYDNSERGAHGPDLLEEAAGKMLPESAKSGAIKFRCFYVTPNASKLDQRKNFAAPRSMCSFFIRYSLNTLSGYYCLEDYDELHNHPLTNELRDYCANKVRA